MNSHMSYAIAQARAADVARGAHRARHAERMSETVDRDTSSVVSDGAFVRLRRWVVGTRRTPAVESRGSAAG
jgi:hypothetical protein